MGIPGDTFTALSRLSNRRKVRSVGNEEEPYVPDLSGIDSGADQLPMTSELPGEDSPQSYDARANKIVDVQEQQPDFYDMGQNLANFVNIRGQQEQPQQDQEPMKSRMAIPQPVSLPRQEPMQQPPPVDQSPSTQADDPGFFSRLGSGLSNILGGLKEEAAKPYEPAESVKKGLKSAGDYITSDFREAFKTTEDRAQEQLAQQQTQEERQLNIGQEIQQSVEEPWEHAVWGATDMVAQSPEARNELKRLGFDISDEELNAIGNAEASISNLTDLELQAQNAWNDDIAGLRQRIEENIATDRDKYLIGLALLMPLILGITLGPEAGLGALSGGMKGYADVLSQRDKNIREDEKTISELTKLKRGSQIETEKLKLQSLEIPSKVKKAMGDHPQSHLEGYKGMWRTNPETGEKEIAKVELAPGLLADADYIPDKETRNKKIEEAKSLNDEREDVQKLQKSTNRIAQIVTQIDEPGWMTKFFNNWTLDSKRDLKPLFGKTIMLDGKKVNAAVILAKEIQEMVDNRRRAMKIRGLGPQVVAHTEELFTDPLGHFTNPEDLMDQVSQMYTDSRDLLAENARRKGFDKDHLLDDFRENDRNLWQYLNENVRGKKQVDKIRQYQQEEEDAE